MKVLGEQKIIRTVTFLENSKLLRENESTGRAENYQENSNFFRKQ